MKLNKLIAKQIVARAMKIIPNSVNVMDESGVIIASGDPARIGQRHTGAVLALRRDQAVEVDENLAKQWNYEAKQGINLPLHYLGTTVGVVGISGEPNAVRQYAQWVKMAAELILEQAFVLEQESWSRRYKEAFTRQVLEGSLSQAQLEQQAVFFALDFAMPLAVVLIQISSPTAEKLQTLLAYVEHHYPKYSAAVMDLDKIALIIPAPAEKTARNKFLTLPDNLPCRVILGLSVIGLPAAAISYQTACNTLAYMQAIQSKRQFVCFDEFKLPALLRDFSHSWQAKTLLAPFDRLLLHDKKQVLLKSLHHYFLSNCELGHASQKLFIHPNTLRYRLEKIEQITGLSFNNIEQKFMLYLGSLRFPKL